MESTPFKCAATQWSMRLAVKRGGKTLLATRVRTIRNGQEEPIRAFVLDVVVSQDSILRSVTESIQVDHNSSEVSKSSKTEAIEFHKLQYMCRWSGSLCMPEVVGAA